MKRSTNNIYQNNKTNAREQRFQSIEETLTQDIIFSTKNGVRAEKDSIFLETNPRKEKGH